MARAGKAEDKSGQIIIGRPARPATKSRHRNGVSTSNVAEAKSISIEDLRRARTAYFSRPTRKQHNEDAIAPSVIKTVKRQSDLRRAHKPVSNRESRSSRTSRSNNHVTGDYVYHYGSGHGDRESQAFDGNPSSSAGTSTNPLPRHGSGVSGQDDADRGERLSNVPESTTERRSSGRLDKSGGRVRSSDISTHVPKGASGRPTAKRSMTSSAIPANRDGAAQATDARPASKHAGAISPSKSTTRRGSSVLASLFRSNSSPAVPQIRHVDCLTCGDDDVPVTKSAKLSCGHRMCHSCLKRIFTMSVTDPAHMPPRCCTSKHIPLKHVDAIFSTRFKLLWNKKYREYTTRNRLYCPRRGCGEWIPPARIHLDTSSGRKVGRCTKCKTKICASCNNQWHRTAECPNDEATRQLIAAAKDKGWQRCFNCKAMVELKEGCNHMTCRCNAEFCMLCGLTWKTCDCPWFNHANVGQADRLDHMRVPRVVHIVRRREAEAGHPERPIRTYQEELAARRRQEQADEALARRLQFAALDSDAEASPPLRRTERFRAEAFGNAGTHALNEDFVQNAANVVMAAFGDARLGRRGERVSERASRPVDVNNQPSQDAGLAPHAFGEPSVMGRVQSPPAPAVNTQRMRLHQANQRSGGEGSSDRIGQWLRGVES